MGKVATRSGSTNPRQDAQKEKLCALHKVYITKKVGEGMNNCNNLNCQYGHETWIQEKTTDYRITLYGDVLCIGCYEEYIEHVDQELEELESKD
jgi:hypothetical protein